MKKPLLVLLLVTAMVTTAKAQDVARVSIADSTTVAENVYRRILKDIDLDPTREAQARRIITHAWVDQMQAQPQAGKTAAEVRDLIRIRRDSSLRALIPREADRARFDKQAKPLVAPPATR